MAANLGVAPGDRVGALAGDAAGSGPAAPAAAPVRDGRTLAADFPTAFDDWTQENVGRTLDRLFAHSLGIAEGRIAWYNKHGTVMGRRSRRIRFWAIVLGTLGTLLPLLDAAFGLPRAITASATVVGDPAYVGYVLLALAAALIAGDSAFGVSSSWMRFRSTQVEMERLLAAFRFDWAIEVARFDGQPPDVEQRAALLRLQRNFADAIEGVAQSETASWMQEFRGALAELAKTYKSAMEVRHPGAIDVHVPNAGDAAGAVAVVIDGRKRGELVGRNFHLADVAPGPHPVQVTGTIDGKPAAASGTVQVKPGEVAKLELTLAA